MISTLEKLFLKNAYYSRPDFQKWLKKSQKIENFGNDSELIQKASANNQRCFLMYFEWSSALRVIPAETRLTVYRWCYIQNR